MAPFTRRRLVQFTAAAAAARALHAAEAFDPAALQRLAGKFSGRLITPQSPDYDSVRRIFNRAFDKRPALIARCVNAQDVSRALVFARERGLAIAVRGGGHNRAGLSVCDGGV